MGLQRLVIGEPQLALQGLELRIAADGPVGRGRQGGAERGGGRGRLGGPDRVGVAMDGKGSRRDQLGFGRGVGSDLRGVGRRRGALGQGRFAAGDLLGDIQGLAAHIAPLRVEGED